jgi:hypothetical protein
MSPQPRTRPKLGYRLSRRLLIIDVLAKCPFRVTLPKTLGTSWQEDMLITHEWTTAKLAPAPQDWRLMSLDDSRSPAVPSRYFAELNSHVRAFRQDPLIG